MARASTFSALFILLGLSYALWGAFGAHIGAQPPPTSNPATVSLPSVILPASCPAGHYECPKDSQNARILIDCSVSEQGKLQCVYGDSTSSAMDGSLGNIVTENGVNAVPTIDVCSYDFVSRIDYVFRAHNILMRRLSSFSFRVSCSSRLPLHVARAPLFVLCIRPRETP